MYASLATLGVCVVNFIPFREKLKVLDVGSWGWSGHVHIRIKKTPKVQKWKQCLCKQAEPRDWAGPTVLWRLPAQPSICPALCDALRVFHFSSLLTISWISHKLWASSLPVTCRCTTKSSAPSQQEMLGNITGVNKCKHPWVYLGNTALKCCSPSDTWMDRTLKKFY